MPRPRRDPLNLAVKLTVYVSQATLDRMKTAAGSGSIGVMLDSHFASSFQVPSPLPKVDKIPARQHDKKEARHNTKGKFSGSLGTQCSACGLWPVPARPEFCAGNPEI